MNMKDRIDYKDIKKLFDSDKWDIAYVSSKVYQIAGHKPIKFAHHFTGVDLVQNSDSIVSYNGIILARYTEETNNYALYQESKDILNKRYQENLVYNQVYVNFKEVALLSGFAKRARNSLVYNRKFGFQCKLCAYMFVPPIVNYEKLEPSTELLDLCEGCDDCIRNCPVGAIHEDHIEMYKCGAFMVCGNHPTITSKKWFWYEKMKPNYTREEIESLEYHPGDDLIFNQHKSWGKGVDGFYEMSADGVELKKDGVTIEWPHCKECQKQPRCSKAPVFSDDK